MDSTWTYFLLLGASILYPLAQSFEWRITMHRKFRFIWPGIFLTAIPFLIWDVLFTQAGIWGFNHEYTRDLYIAGLPLEEILFFLVVPYCIFFTYEVLRYFVKKFYFPQFSKIVLWTLLGAAVLSLPFVYSKTYTFTAIAFVVPFLALQLIIKSYKTWFSGFLLVYLVSALPFLVINGFLTRLPVVWYNDAQNMGIRLWTIPLEDSIYLLGLLLPIHLIYHALLERRASPQLRMDMGLDEPSGF